MSKLIGPLTSEEWCSLRATGEDDDILQCCAETSDLRDGIFMLLRMGADKNWAKACLDDMPRVSVAHDDFCLKDDRLRKLWEYAGFEVEGPPA